jgi:[methyl-Co(III) methanol-specific corrinoid protein]:coenzyme M methyltransferase
MTPKERVLNAIFSREVDRIPVVSVTSVAAEDFMRASNAWWPDAHRDPEKMAKLGSAAHKMAGLESVNVPFCLTVEVEALGCQVSLHKRGERLKWPSVTSSPVKEPTNLEIPEDLAERGRIPTVLKAIRLLREEIGEEVSVVSYVTGPLTMAGYLVGHDQLLMMSLTDPKEARALLEMASRVAAHYGALLKEAGADIITIQGPSACCDVISPNMFNDLVKPSLKWLVAQLKPPRILHICGTVRPILRSMAECGAEALSVDERVDIAEAKKVLGPKPTIVGNIAPISVLFKGTPKDVERAVIEAIEAGVDMVAPGCDLWPYTPAKNVKTMVETVKKYGERGSKNAQEPR